MQQASGCARVDDVKERMEAGSAMDSYKLANESTLIPYIYSTGDLIGPGESIYVLPCKSIYCKME